LQTDFEEDLVKKAIIDVFENNFNDNKILSDADELSRKLVDDTMKELFKLKKLFKYAVSVFVQQKNGSAMNFGSNRDIIFLIYLKVRIIMKICRMDVSH
jgi:hypothetical protein